MNKNYLKQTIIIILIIINLTFLEKKAYAAVDQILNGNFYQNPAELSQIKQMQLLAGNIFTVPQFTFNGITPLGSGSVRSKAHNLLPYLLTAYRFTDRFVFGANLTPSAYGHLKWPLNSIVAESSTETYFLYYRAGIQASYKFSNNLALGMGFNLEYNKLGEIDSLIPNRGNQINKIKGVNYTGDIGLFYKINSRNFLTMVVYTDVNTFANGTSSLNNLIIHNFSMNVTEAAVASIGIQHWINDKWFTESKIYWSGWSIEQNLYLINTTTGTRIIPTKWRNPWSFQINTRYTTSDKVALLGSIIYETNAAPTFTNAIGYPLSPYGSISAGLDIALQNNLSAQLLYSYGTFISNAKINSGGDRGKISANIQAAVVQFTYKL